MLSFRLFGEDLVLSSLLTKPQSSPDGDGSGRGCRLQGRSRHQRRSRCTGCPGHICRSPGCACRRRHSKDAAAAETGTAAATTAKETGPDVAPPRPLSPIGSHVQSGSGVLGRMAPPTNVGAHQSGSITACPATAAPPVCHVRASPPGQDRPHRPSPISRSSCCSSACRRSRPRRPFLFYRRHTMRPVSTASEARWSQSTGCFAKCIAVEETYVSTDLLLMYAGVGLEASFRLVEELLFMCRVVVSIFVASVLRSVVLMFSQMPFRLGSSGGGTAYQQCTHQHRGHSSTGFRTSGSLLLVEIREPREVWRPNLLSRPATWPVLIPPASSRPAPPRHSHTRSAHFPAPVSTDTPSAAWCPAAPSRLGTSSQPKTDPVDCKSSVLSCDDGSDFALRSKYAAWSSAHQSELELSDAKASWPVT